MRFGWVSAAAVVAMGVTAPASAGERNYQVSVPLPATGDFNYSGTVSLPGFDPSIGRLRYAYFQIFYGYSGSLTYDARNAPDNYAYYQRENQFYVDSVEGVSTFNDPYTGVPDQLFILPLENRGVEPGNSSDILYQGSYGTLSSSGQAYYTGQTTNISDLYGLSHLSSVTVGIRARRADYVEVLGDPGLIASTPELQQRAIFQVSYIFSGVPEPTSWALMILGVGATGGALRIRRERRREAAVRV